MRYAFLSGAVLEFMTLTAIGVIATMLGVRLLNNGISFDSAFFILLLTPEFYRPLQELGVQRHAAMEGAASGRRIFEILKTPLPTGGEPSVEESFPTGPITIDISALSYTYPRKEQPALDGVSLRLAAHTCTALVGRSGAGKTTLVNLLMRFMDATSGTICANGVPITALSPDRWREYVALVPQRPYLFYGTVRENIRLARPGASDNEVAQAATLAGVTAFIDEPPSSLDPESEALIRQSLITLRCDRTVLVIAHRLNTIAQADRIAVLEDG